MLAPLLAPSGVFDRRNSAKTQFTPENMVKIGKMRSLMILCQLTNKKIQAGFRRLAGMPAPSPSLTILRAEIRRFTLGVRMAHFEGYRFSNRERFGKRSCK
jgi:hypothetical protein